MEPIKIFNLIGKHSKNLYSCGDLINGNMRFPISKLSIYER